MYNIADKLLLRILMVQHQLISLIDFFNFN